MKETFSLLPAFSSWAGIMQWDATQSTCAKSHTCLHIEHHLGWETYSPVRTQRHKGSKSETLRLSCKIGCLVEQAHLELLPQANYPQCMRVPLPVLHWLGTMGLTFLQNVTLVLLFPIGLFKKWAGTFLAVSIPLCLDVLEGLPGIYAVGHIHISFFLLQFVLGPYCLSLVGQ